MVKRRKELVIFAGKVGPKVKGMCIQIQDGREDFMLLIHPAANGLLYK